MKNFFVCLLVFLCVAFYFNSASAIEVKEVSAQKWLNAESFTLEANKDKIVVLEFWATWCPPCRASIPHLKEMSDKYKDKGVVFVSLTNEDVSDKLIKFCNANKMSWVIGLGSNSANDYGVRGIPHAFIIADGKIKWEGHPMDKMDSVIDAVVAEKTNNSSKK